MKHDILEMIKETLRGSDERQQFINDTMKFQHCRDDRAAGVILERAEVLEFDSTLMLLEAR